MIDQNTICFTGRLGKDPDLRVTPTGKSVCTMSVANSRKRRQPDGSYKETTVWYRVIVWDKAAESSAEYLKKGQQVAISGEHAPREYVDKDGKSGLAQEVINAQVTFLGGKSDSSSLHAADEDWGEPVVKKSGKPNHYDDAEEMEPEDIPF